MQILVNQVGYETGSAKRAVLKNLKTGEAPRKTVEFVVREENSGKTVFKGKGLYVGPVDSWKDWIFWTLDFSDLRKNGRYSIELPPDGGSTEAAIRSEVFEIGKNLLLTRTVPAVLRYFRSQRCRGFLDEADRSLSFVGKRNDCVDVHGGWYDASGDKSKYLSHLSYANYFNPQQSQMAVWNFVVARDLLEEHKSAEPSAESMALDTLRSELLAEALYGADFLVRMQDAEGYFYIGVFDKWSKDPLQREICSFQGQEGHKSDDYQAGYRQGGGVAIAALSRISTLDAAGGFMPEQYLQAAIRGFQHLERYNKIYLDDGRENIIDDYCALLAASELYAAAKMQDLVEGPVFLEAARRRANRLISRLSRDERFQDWWGADEDGRRPYFHAVEAGLPVLSLLRYSEIEPLTSRVTEALTAARAALSFELRITEEVANPFGYARQYVKAVNGEKRSSFFIPHNNETGYWWQGEDARLASLSAAAALVSQALRTCLDLPGDKEFFERLRNYGSDQLNWILGLNPYDTCMLHGFGRNNPEYESAFPNAFGGICNGITAGFSNELDIDFLPLPLAERGDHRWRWSEQWIPHGAWYLLAVCANFAHSGQGPDGSQHKQGAAL